MRHVRLSTRFETDVACDVGIHKQSTFVRSLVRDGQTSPHKPRSSSP
jgi:hypothetical protein